MNPEPVPRKPFDRKNLQRIVPGTGHFLVIGDGKLSQHFDPVGWRRHQRADRRPTRGVDRRVPKPEVAGSNRAGVYFRKQAAQGPKSRVQARDAEHGLSAAC
jgi:hypothetical protein